MKVAIYPGSFNPWHKGHQDILQKALQVFDVVYVCFCHNPDKEKRTDIDNRAHELQLKLNENYGDKAIVQLWSGLVVDNIKSFGENVIHAVIRGLRNGHDLQYEMNLQYHNEDLGLKIPVVYFVTDRVLSHISSSAIRQINKFKNV